MKRLVVLFTMLGMLAALAHAGVIFNNNEVADALNPAPAGSVWGPGPGGAVGGIGGPVGFVMPFPGLFSITVTDCCLVGDVYEVIVDGASLGLTSQVPIDGPTNSTGTWVMPLAAGAHTYDVGDVVLQYIGVNSPFGGGVVPEGYSPAGLTVIGEEVPEPSTYLLFGAGLLGLLGLRRKRA